jgi:hypothetical protein
LVADGVQMAKHAGIGLGNTNPLAVQDTLMVVLPSAMI